MASPLTLHSSASATSLLPDSASGRSTGGSRHPGSLSEKYSLSPNPASWGTTALLVDAPEPDDFLHNPDPRRDRTNDRGGHIFTSRGIANLGCLFFLATAMLLLFAGYPILSHFLAKPQTTQGGFNLGGTNGTGQVAAMPGNYGLIDLDTPQEAYTRASYLNPGDTWNLVFSDEFNQDGRTFFPGDDPYWEAVDLYYWQTTDLEWYDPLAVTTSNGSLKITMTQVEPINNHNMTYRSGMIQTWNKFCFTGGLIEAAVTLPGASNVVGLWPAMWTMGNLGRAGYGASLDGMWPYSYDSCDVGTLPNQTFPGTSTPLAAVEHGDPQNNDMLSYLPGQRLSGCTCPGESHPGPVHANGDYVGRSSPEIDIFEAIVHLGVANVSQSAQWAPFNAEYKWLNNSGNLIINDPTVTSLNQYIGGAYQQTTSGLSVANQGCYELEQQCFAVYAFEYQPGFDNAYITWVNDNKVSWTMKAAGMVADSATEISARPVSQEPMYIIANLGMSYNFGGNIDFENLIFPTTMSIDYVRVYQPSGSQNIGCDPLNFPTADYINTYIDAYTNANLTRWISPSFNQTFPKNRLNGGC